MEIKYTQVTNPKWADQEHTVIDCMVVFEHFGAEPVPFSCRPTDPEVYASEIFTRCVSGEFGIVQEYTPLELTEEMRAIDARVYRRGLLSDLDSIVSNPLRWASFSAEKQKAYADYRQALLDVPQQAGFPYNIIWPTLPQ